MGGSSKKQTVGYRYYMDLHFGVCYGPVDRVRRLFAGDREAWSGDQTATGQIQISKPSLFGGDEKEGGLKGTLDVMMGGSMQTLPSTVAAKLPNPSPAFRGVLSLFYSGQVSANNPYIKPIAPQVERILSGWHGGTAWYAAKAVIGSVTNSNALTLIQSAFTSSDSRDAWADISAYSAAVSGYTQNVVDGVGYVLNSSNSSPEEYLIYQGGQVPSAITFEFFVFVESTGNYGEAIFSIQLPSSSSIIFGVGGAAQRAFLNLGAGVVYGASNDGAQLSGRVHVSMQFSGGIMCLHINGVKVHQQSFNLVAAASFQAIIGGSGYTGDAPMQYTVDSFRVRGEAVYGSGNFTPPAVLPAPDASGSTGFRSMNPAHIIYECLTNPVWGMGYPTQTIGSTFAAAADALFAEGFGLCLLWNRQDEIGAFVRTVLDHIGAVLYVDPKTGLFELKLLRADYNVQSLPVFGPNNVAALESFQRVGYGDTVNEVTVVYRDAETNRDSLVTVQNLANVQAQGAVIGKTVQYPGIPSASLALRAAQRDLLALSTPLAKVRLRVNREAWALAPGQVFALEWPKLGITTIVMRVLGINYGELRDGTIEIDAAEDVFGLPASSYAAQEPPGWSEPSVSPTPVTRQAAIEVPYRVLVSELTSAELAALDTDSAYLAILAAQPAAAAQGFDIYSRVGSAGFEQRAAGAFVAAARLAASIGPTTTLISLENAANLDFVAVGSLAVIGSGRSAEWVMVTAIDTGAPSVTVSRGILDTVPKAHADETQVFFGDGREAPEGIERATSETVDFKLATKTGGGTLDISLASQISATAEQRQHRPYAPGNFRIAGQAYPASLTDTVPTITWAHRSRLQQTAGYIEQNAGNIGPEDGTTYCVEMRNADTDVVLLSQTDITGTTYTPASPPAGQFNLRVRLWSQRQSSTQSQTVSVSATMTKTQSHSASLAQIVTFALSGTPLATEQYKIEMQQGGRTAIFYAGSQSSLSGLLDSFRNVIDSDWQYSATVAGSVLTVTGTVNVPFTYSFSGTGIAFFGPYVESWQRHDWTLAYNYTPPPPQPAPSLLMHFNGSNGSTTMTDSSTLAHTVTAFGNAQLSDSAPKFGTAALLLDGSGDYLTVPYHANLHLSTGDFTIEAWVKTSSTTTLLSFGTSGGNVAWEIWRHSGGYMRFVSYNDAGTFYMLSQNSGASVGDGNWRHVAVTRAGNTWRLFVDGVVADTQTFTHSIRASATGPSYRLVIGGTASTGSNWNGRIDELRIVPGVAVWTAAFTPPTAEYPNP